MDGSRAAGVVWSVLSAELARRAEGGDPPVLDVLDLGGGSGVSAVPLAELGHRVTVVDTSADALATLQRRAADAGVADLVTPVQGDVERPPAAVADEAYDLVLCHSLLEVVDEPDATLATVAGALRPGGCASVLAAEGVLRRFDTAGLVALVAAAGLRVEAVHGVRVVADLVPGAVADGEPGAAEALRQLEAAVAGLPPYRDLAAQLHVLGRR